MPKPKLTNTALCAIIRDEKTNPAGGIVDFIHMTVPHVTRAVIVDTGSLDGTKDLLKKLQRVYPHLHVCHHPFNGYADARNKSLAEARALNIPWALILDADERLSPEDFKKIQKFRKAYPTNCYLFDFIAHFQDYNVSPLNTQEARLFKNLPQSQFRSDVGETFTMPNVNEVYVDGVRIHHFLPSPYGKDVKKAKWYDISFNPEGIYIPNSPAPSQTKEFRQWKKLNPMREKLMGPIRDKITQH